MAKLLFVTQKVDKDDAILGVYHRWIEVLSKRLETVDVICLYQGRTELPANVGVFSLGKERNESGIRNQESGIINKLKYAHRFYKYIWRLRHEYDTVLVHMNPVYIVLGGLFWKLSGKSILLWYNHPLGNLMARVGICLADKVFCTSPYAFPRRYQKTVLMPVGVDADFFKPMPEVIKNRRQILYLGRVSPIKKIEYLIEAAKVLDGQGLDFKVVIVGSPGSAEDREYESKLKKASAGLVSGGRVEFRPAAPNYRTPGIYNSSGVFVNLTPSGSFDKVIFEAMACEVLILVSNKSLADILPADLRRLCVFEENNRDSLAGKLALLLNMPDGSKSRIAGTLRDIAVRNHGLDTLVLRLSRIFNDGSP